MTQDKDLNAPRRLHFDRDVPPAHRDPSDREPTMSTSTTAHAPLPGWQQVGSPFHAGEQAVQTWVTRFPGDDDEWIENLGYNLTRDYVKKIIGGRRAYQLLYRHQS